MQATGMRKWMELDEVFVSSRSASPLKAIKSKDDTQALTE